ncbi:MAG TPA: amidohydrolase family protein [Candidatus Methylomirabilis sp.]|nr:amidohydrolase family protein [Candidatus Methylomirabilis sp.]
MRLLTARWVFPVTSPPIADGAVAIQGGEILGVGPSAEVVGAFSGARRLDLGDAALLPGLVNCHTHLELGGLTRPATDGGFVEWVVAVIEGRREMPLAAQAAAAERGVQSVLRSGTTCIGEVSSTGQSLSPLLQQGLRGVVYREILGLPPEEAESRCQTAGADVQGMQAVVRGGRLRIGLSPHSPYGLSEELFGACDSWLRGSGLPCCIHIAESRDEVEFLATGGGRIPCRLYPAVGCEVPPPRGRAGSPVEYLGALGALRWRPLLVHAVHVDAVDTGRMLESGVSVAHCPRSNARLSEGVAPVAEFLRQGIPVGLGTDSLASVPSLDLWDEMRAALAAHAGRLSPEAVLGLATLGGARVLGLEDSIGSLAPGKRADLIAVAAEAVKASDPIGSLIAGTRGENVLLSLIEGEVRFSRSEGMPCA